MTLGVTKTEDENSKAVMAFFSYRTDLKQFIRESNHIEGIHRDPTMAEIDALEKFLKYPALTIASLVDLNSVFQPNAVLRDKAGLDVRIGGYIPPRGGPEIVEDLNILLLRVSAIVNPLHPWKAHLEYESLHPFTDGNGRTGRAVWLWQMKQANFWPNGLAFLHQFYYQTLANQETRE